MKLVAKIMSHQPSFYAVCLLLSLCATRYFGLPREVFFFIFLCLAAVPFLSNFSAYAKFNSVLIHSLAITLLLCGPGFGYFLLQDESDISQYVLMNLSVAKIYLATAILSKFSKPNKNKDVFYWPIMSINRFAILSIAFGWLQWLLMALGKQNLASFGQNYKIVGFFPLFRVNSFFPESQHFSIFLAFFLAINFYMNAFGFLKFPFLNAKSKKYVNKFNISQANIISTNSLTFISGSILLVLNGSTTGYFVIVYFIFFFFGIPIFFQTVLSMKSVSFLKFRKIAVFSKKKLIILLLIFLALIGIYASGFDSINRMYLKQAARLEMVSTVLFSPSSFRLGSSEVLRGSRAVSFEKSSELLSGQLDSIPEYSRDAQSIYKDGFILNLSRFGFIGSALITISFLVPLLYFRSYLSFVGFGLWPVLFWMKGISYPSPELQVCFCFLLLSSSSILHSRINCAFGQS